MSKNFVEQLKDYQNKNEEKYQSTLVEKSKIANEKSAIVKGPSFMKEKKGKMKVIPGGK